MKKLLIYSFMPLFFLLAGTALAQQQCQPIYGGGQTCIQRGKINLQKTVQHPTIKPDDITSFKITVKNNESDAMKNITVKDTLDGLLTFVAAGSKMSGKGNFDTKSKTVTFTIQELKPAQTEEITITVKAAPADRLPGNGNGRVCIINHARATQDERISEDNAEVCIQKDIPATPTPGAGKGGQPQPTTPPQTKGEQPVYPPQDVNQNPQTGAEAVALAALIPTGLAGFALRKFAGRLGRKIT